MTDGQVALMRQLSDLIKEKFGSISRFAGIYGYKEKGLRRILHGVTNNFDERLYDMMRDQCLNHKSTVNTEVVLLTRIIAKHYGSQEACCRAIKIRKSTLLRILDSANTTSTEFIALSQKVYSSYLHKQEGIEEYVNTMAPARFLNEIARRRQNLKKLTHKKAPTESPGP
jgi:hypothetical protein